jgi:hypothetical protein
MGILEGVKQQTLPAAYNGRKQQWYRAATGKFKISENTEVSVKKFQVFWPENTPQSTRVAEVSGAQGVPAEKLDSDENSSPNIPQLHPFS